MLMYASVNILMKFLYLNMSVLFPQQIPAVASLVVRVSMSWPPDAREHLVSEGQGVWHGPDELNDCSVHGRHVHLLQCVWASLLRSDFIERIICFSSLSYREPSQKITESDECKLSRTYFTPKANEGNKMYKPQASLSTVFSFRRPRLWFNVWKSGKSHLIKDASTHRVPWKACYFVSNGAH